MDLERRQRNDIDIVNDNRLTLDIDALPLVTSPYIVVPENYEGNNWLIVNNRYIKYSIAEDDTLAFVFDPISDLGQKNITEVIVSFDTNATSIMLDNISLSHDDMVEQEMCEMPIKVAGHIDVSCNIFGLDNEVLNSIISEQGFTIGLNFKGLKSNALVRIWNVEVSFKFSNKLYDESDAVVNRLEPYVDFYRDEDELILQIGDGSGKGHKEDQGGDIDAYTKAEVDAKLELKVNTEVGKGLSSNDYTLTEKNKLAGIENGANNYTHPANHYTNMIREESALQNLEVSANSTQHDINLAIDSKITQGGGVDIVTQWEQTLSDTKVASEKLTKNTIDSKQDELISGTNIKTVNNQSLLGSGNINIQGGGSVIGTGSFTINNNGHLIVELPDVVSNPYFINNEGHLIYDTHNSYNGDD